MGERVSLLSFSPIFEIFSFHQLGTSVTDASLILNASLDGTRFCITNLVEKTCSNEMTQLGTVWISLKYKRYMIYVQCSKGISKTIISLYHNTIDCKRADIEFEGQVVKLEKHNKR